MALLTKKSQSAVVPNTSWVFQQPFKLSETVALP